MLDSDSDDDADLGDLRDDYGDSSAEGPEGGSGGSVSDDAAEGGLDDDLEDVLVGVAMPSESVTEGSEEDEEDLLPSEKKARKAELKR